MSKYKVDDWVKIPIPPTLTRDADNCVGHILEVNIQICEAGIEQVSYQVRIWADHKGKAISLLDVLTFREMELGEKVEKREQK
ncbi:MAG: hypothetical protein ACUZ9M_00680 [Candidatus Scalindua sp.]